MVERESFCLTNLVYQMEKGELDTCPIYPDLLRFPWEKYRGLVDIVSGGFPCQPFSTAGNRKSTEDERHLWPFIKRGVSVLGPRVCFFENVDGIATAKSPGYESVLHHVLSDLEELGYRAEAGCFTAAEVGAPHIRRRWFILAVANFECEGLERHPGHVEQKIGQDRGRQSCRSTSESSLQLANSDPDSRDQGESRRAGCLLPEEGDGLRRGEGQGEAGQEPRCGGEVAHSDSCRRGQDWEQGQPQPTESEQPPGDPWPNRERVAKEIRWWPKEPGDTQYVWEEPRVIKPKLGGATNGLPFRVDRLRALGNSVVPQVAAFAFESLWKRLNK